MSMQIAPMPDDPRQRLDEIGLGGAGGRGGGPTRGRGEGEGPSAIVTRIVRAAGYDEGWPLRAVGELERLASGDAGVFEPSLLVDMQEALMREIFSYRRSGSADFHDNLAPGGLIIYQEDAFRTSAVVLFEGRDDVATEIPSLKDLAAIHKTLLPNAFRIWRETDPFASGSEIEFSDFSDLARFIPIPVVMAPVPSFELTGSSALIERGDGLVSDLLTTVGMRSYRDGTQGILTVAHAVGTSKKLVHKPSGVAFDLTENYFNENWPAWDVAFLKAPDGLDVSEQNRHPALTSSVIATVAPGKGTIGTFYGAESGKQDAVVEGSDFILPHFGPRDIGRFYTARVTREGDSGSVLVDDKGAALGMTTSRTTVEYFLPLSTWMFMPGVLAAAQASIEKASQAAQATAST